VTTTQSQPKGIEATRKYWKDRRNLAADALARLKSDERNDTYAKVLAVHADGLNSPDPRTRRLAEGIVNTFKAGNLTRTAADLNKLIRAVNRMHLEIVWSITMQVRWLIPVPLSWLGYEIGILREGWNPEEEQETMFLTDQNNLCFGLDIDIETFFRDDNDLELRACWMDPTYPHEDAELSQEVLKQMIAGVEECRIATLKKAGIQ
jgi:hypothetical protein